MKVLFNGKKIDLRAVWLENAEKGIIKMIDQRMLPWKLVLYESKKTEETAWAIKKMVVRGAPTIGITGAYGVYQAALEVAESKNFLEELTKKVRILQNTRPTAVNLFNMTEHMLNEAKKHYSSGATVKEIVDILRNTAEKLAEQEIKANEKIGELGNSLIENNSSILTHCNAGALAAVDYGTALAPIRKAHYSGKRILVYVDETRPWLQGARLTAWELEMEGIPYFLIPDNVAGLLMSEGQVDIVIVGADRIAMNGDVANKIGTYKLAVLAKENKVPFYVAAPLSTFDPKIKTGKEIPIEERSKDEVIYVRGFDDTTGKIIRVRIAPLNARVKNPVFDVTPNKYITGIITERGILRSQEDIKRVVNSLD